MFGKYPVLTILAARRLETMAILMTATFLAPTLQVQAQQIQTHLDARIVVFGEGSVNVAPDHAQINSGVRTRAKTVKDGTEANSKVMAGIIAAMVKSGVPQKDIQTSRFSIQPAYAPAEPRVEQKLVGYNVSNQVRVTITQMDKIGEILDQLVAAGVTDVGNIVFLVSDISTALDEARKAAIADARRKAEVYAQASDLRLGRILWVTEDAGMSQPILMRAQSAPAAKLTSTPIEAGDETLRARVSVGFDIVR